MKPSSSNVQGPVVRSAETGAKAGPNGPTFGAPSGQHSRPRPRPKGATFDAVLSQADSASIGAALASVITPGNHLVGDGGKAIAAFARKAGIPFHAVPTPGKSTPEAPHLHISSTPTMAASSNGSTASTASPLRTCPTIPDGGAPSKPGAANSRRKPGSKAPSETAHTNRYRYKSLRVRACRK
jgi:hypothetical protein